MSEMFPYARRGIQVVLLEPGGSSRTLEADGIRISTERIDIRVAGFVHPKTAGKIGLPTRSGEPRIVPGVVADCQYLRGTHHRVSFMFRDAVELDELDGLEMPESASGSGRETAARPIRVLYLDDHEIELSLLVHRLAGTSVEVLPATHMGRAMDLLRHERFDLVLCDLHLEDGQLGLELLNACREGLHEGAFVFLTGEDSSTTLGTLARDGVDAVVSKPVDFEALPRLLSGAVEARSASGVVPIDSGGWRGDEGALREFVGSFAERITSLKRAKMRRETDSVLRMCRDLVSSADGFGLTVVGRTADQAIGAIRYGGGIQLAGDAIDALVEALEEASSRAGVAA